jgi:hypothetical protein
MCDCTRGIQAEDRPIAWVRKSEKDYFSNTMDFTVARNLTVASSWGFRYRPHLNPFQNAKMFIADPKLWAWVSKAKELREHD